MATRQATERQTKTATSATALLGASFGKPDDRSFVRRGSEIKRLTQRVGYGSHSRMPIAGYDFKHRVLRRRKQLVTGESTTT